MTLKKSFIGAACALAIAIPATSAQAREEEEIFALGALAGAGAIIVLGGLTAAAKRHQRVDTVQPLNYAPITGTRVSDPSAHLAYCSERYRSFDAASGTFQPNNGPRRACVSPYSR